MRSADLNARLLHGFNIHAGGHQTLVYAGSNTEPPAKRLRQPTVKEVLTDRHDLDLKVAKFLYATGVPLHLVRQAMADRDYADADAERNVSTYTFAAEVHTSRTCVSLSATAMCRTQGRLTMMCAPLS